MASDSSVALAYARGVGVRIARMAAACVNGSCNQVRCGACNARRRVQLTMISAETRGPSLRKKRTCAHACCSVPLFGGLAPSFPCMPRFSRLLILVCSSNSFFTMFPARVRLLGDWWGLSNRLKGQPTDFLRSVWFIFKIKVHHLLKHLKQKWFSW